MKKQHLAEVTDPQDEVRRWDDRVDELRSHLKRAGGVTPSTSEPVSNEGQAKKAHETKPLTKSGKLKLYGFLAVLFLALCFKLVGLVNEYREEGRMEDWHEKAEAAVQGNWTVEDARQWLERNGFDVTHWSPHAERGWIGLLESGDGSWTVVHGDKHLTRKTLFFGDSWVELYFRFDLDDGSFQGVEARMRRFGRPEK